MVLHLWFNLHFPVTSDVEHFFMYLFVICKFSLEKCLSKHFYHFLLGQLNTSLLSYVCFQKFPPINDLSLISVFLKNINYQFWWKSNFQFFLFWIAYLVSHLGNLCLTKLQRFSPLFYSRHFRVFGFISKSYDPFWINCYIWCKVWEILFFLHVDVQLFHHHLLKRLPFIELPLHLCWYIYVYF